jgi:hypothetical protein
MYGEIGREDHNGDLRDLIAEPDHDMSYLIGFQRVFQVSAQSLSALRIELLDSRISHLEAVRGQALPYVHGVVIQGHTELGQILGAPGGAGGGASSVTFTRETPSRAWSIGWTRLLGCDGTGGTAGCDNEALELTGSQVRGRYRASAGLSLVNRREALTSDHRVTGLSLNIGVAKLR